MDIVDLPPFLGPVRFRTLFNAPSSRMYWQALVTVIAKELGIYPALTLDEGTEWGRSRRLIAPHFSGHNVRAMVPAIVEVSTCSLAWLRGVRSNFRVFSTCIESTVRVFS